MEPSAEAIAAGTAAAAAVDEIQTREALDESLAVTAAVAGEAEARAEDAQTEAQIAAQAAVEAVGAVSEVAGAAYQAQETAEVATEVAQTAAVEAAETREHVRTVDDKLDMILAHLERQSEPQQGNTGVQEVEVHDNAPSQQEDNSDTGESDSVQSGPSRRRAGRLARRAARGRSE